LCDLCNSSYDATSSCPYYACYDQFDFILSWDNTNVVLSVLGSSLPLAQCTELEEGDPFGFDGRFDVVDTCFELEDIFDKVHDLVKTLLEESYDVFMHEESPSLSFDNSFVPNLLDYLRVSPACSQPFFPLSIL